MIKQCWINGTIVLQYGATKIRCNIRCIKTYKSDTNVEDITTENMYDDFNILSPVIYLFIILNLGESYIIGYARGHWHRFISILSNVHVKFFMAKSFYSHEMCPM